MLVEGNVTNNERLYRNFINMVKAYRPGISAEEISIEKTPKGNWRVYDANCKKVCLISKFILNDNVVDGYNIRRCSECK